MTATEKTASTGEALRALLDRPAILDQPTICDPLGARLAADAGYEAVALGGQAIGAHLPLTSELSFAAIEQAASAVVRACGLPLLLDADVGWGDAGGIPRALTRLEATGVAAVVVSSQHLLAEVPFDAAAEREHASAGLFARLRAARAARTSLLVMARCAVPAGDSYDCALGKAASLLDAGADAVLLDAPVAQLPTFPRDLPGATLIYAGPAEARPKATAPQLQRWGYRGLNLQYHRCYCARKRLSSAGAADQASLSSLGLNPGPTLTARREDLERKQ